MLGVIPIVENVVARIRATALRSARRGLRGLACALLVAGCHLDTDAYPRAKLVLEVDAEPEVKAVAAVLRLSVVGAQSSYESDAPESELERELTPGRDGVPDWPVRVSLAPNHGDAKSQYSVTASAFDSVGNLVAEVRLTSSYVVNQIRVARLLLTDACLEVACSAKQTCKQGECVQALRDPATFPFFTPRADAGVMPIADASADAEPSAEPSGETDAGVDSDAGIKRGPGNDGLVAIATAVAAALGDPCVTHRDGCDPLVTCQSYVGIAICGACPSGYDDVNGDGTQCREIDECATDNGGCDAKHARCTNTAGSHDCRCAEGYHGDGVRCTLNVGCNDTTACSEQAECRSSDHLCVCVTGYEGDGANCKDIDECARNTDRCDPNAQCINSEGSFSCPCLPGFKAVGTTCVDIDECALQQDDCSELPEACVNTPGGFSCQCPAGYIGPAKGAAGCVDINECATNNGGCALLRACVNMPGSYSCGACATGYTPSGSGGCADIDECDTNNGGCVNRACINTPGAVICSTCDVGYETSGPSTCSDINECLVENGGCGDQRVCTNTAGGHVCDQMP
jgi:hypothetical protein